MSDDLAAETLTGQMPGYTQAWWALIRDRRLSDGAVRLYLLIASHCRGHRNVAWPGQARLAELSGASPSTVKRHLAELVAAKWIVTHRPDRNKGNRYVVMMPSPQPVDDLVDSESRGVKNDPSEGSKMSHPRSEVEEHEVTPHTPRVRGAGRRVGVIALTDEERRQDFEQWWGRYPVKKSKADAMRAWKQVLADLPPIMGLVAASRALADVTAREHPGSENWQRYMPYPATYLRGARWLDGQAEGEPVSVRRPVNPCVLCGVLNPLETCDGRETAQEPDLWNEMVDCPWRRP